MPRLTVSSKFYHVILMINDNYNFFILDNLLQATSVPIVSNDYCLKKQTEDFNSTDMICGGHLDGGHGTCYGDSGGPLQCRLSDGKWYLIGVVSWGGDGKLQCAVEGYLDVYANVVNLIDWVQKSIADN